MSEIQNTIIPILIDDGDDDTGNRENRTIARVGSYSLYQHNIDSIYHWVDDLIIDAYIFTLCEQFNALHLQSHLMREWSVENYTSTNKLRESIGSKRWLLGGVNVNGNHWILLVADNQKLVYYELNSMREIISNAINHFGLVNMSL